MISKNILMTGWKQNYPEICTSITLNYARQLYNHSGLLCKAEDLDLEETLMIRTAGLLFPLGYINSYENPEIEAAAIARKILASFSSIPKNKLTLYPT